MERVDAQQEISPTLLSQANQIGLGHVAVDAVTGEITGPSEVDEGFSARLHKVRADRWPRKLAEALDDAQRLTGRRCLPPGYFRRYFRGRRFRLLKWLRHAYPETWVDRAMALVELGAPPSAMPRRHAELQQVLVEFVQSPGSPDLDFDVLSKRRSDGILKAKLVNALRDAGVQKRNLGETVWLTAYLLDCYERRGCRAFSRSLDQIITDAPAYLDLNHRTEVSRVIGRVTAGWNPRKAPRIPILRCVNKGHRTNDRSLASDFDLNPEYAEVAGFVAPKTRRT